MAALVEGPPAGLPATRRRPPVVTILASLQIVQAVIAGVAAILVIGDPASGPEVLKATAVTRSADLIGLGGLTWAGAFLAVLALLEVTAAVLLLRMRRAGWTLSMLLAGFSLTSQIVDYVQTGIVLPVAMVLSVVTVLYLNQGSVRASFGLVSGRTDIDEDPAR